MSNDEFGQRPFAEGTLRGIRAFSVTSTGGLTGVVHKQAWSAEVNVAQCMKPKVSFFVPSNGVEREHELVSLGCACGMYAYFDGSNDYIHDRWHTHNSAIAGVIEGWGKCVVGTRGFRCEKAIIKALVVPMGHTSEHLAEVLGQVQSRYPVAWFDSQDAALVEFPLTNAWSA